MFRMFNRSLNRKGQNTAEYALLISLVVAAIIAMQTYAQRTIQARIRDASAHLTSETSALGNSVQYEPYYLETSYATLRNENLDQIQNQQNGAFVFQTTEDTTRTRSKGGYQVSTYSNETNGLIHGI